MSDIEKDIEDTIKKLSRKTDINIQKLEYSFDKQLKKLDNEIDNLVKGRLSEFDKNKKLTSDYLSIDYSTSTIDQYREKLKKI